MGKITIQLEGVPQTTRRLSELSRRAQSRVVRKAVRAGGAPIVKAVRQGTPRRKGLLRRATTQKVKVYTRSKTTLAIVGAKSRLDPTTGENPAKYLHLVERGTRAHVIPGPVKLPGGGIARNIRHPGAQPSSHMFQAGRATERTALSAFSDKYAAELQREVQSLQSTS